MTRDYAKYNFSSSFPLYWLRHSSPRLVGALILGALFILSLLILIIGLALRPSTTPAENAPDTVASSDKTTVQKPLAKTSEKLASNSKGSPKHVPVEKQKPRFDFYTLLPQSSPNAADPVVDTAHSNQQSNTASPEKLTDNRATLSASLSANKDSAAIDTKTSAKTNTLQEIQKDLAFVLQAGSFKSLEEADNLRARLSLMGFENPYIKEVSLDSHPWFRVFVGPFASKAEALGEQQRLEHQNLGGSLILKIRS